MSEGLGDLAKRWIRAKRTELLTGNKRERENADAAADDAQRQMSDRAMHQAVRAAVPGLARWEDDQAARAAAADEQERAEILARPRAAVSLSVAGPWGSGTWQGELPARAERERDDDTGEVTLRVELETLDELAPQVAGRPLYALRLELRPYTGPGRYDPAAGGEDLDPFAYTLEYAYRDEAFYYTPDAGPGTVEITAGEQQLDLDLPMQGASGDLRLTATVTLPPVGDPAAERAAAESQQRRAFFAGLPKAAVQLSVTGPVGDGSWAGELGAFVNQDRAEDGAPSLQVLLASAADPAPQLAGLPLLALRVDVADYRGPGHYDLVAGNGADEPGSALLLGREDEPFRWDPRLGPGTVDVGPDGRTLDVRLATRGARGELQVAATVTLPAPLPAPG